MKLVIVESPAKCKKIESYLGVGYKCVASYGHIREFLNGLKSFNATDGFTPKYKLMISKKKYINQLRTNIKKSSEVILATDDDREGEAIAWHICMSFDLSPIHTKRIIFHEITKPAIKKALNSPTTLNMNKIYSQQSRQILDLMVGFKVSPILWKNISGKSGLSAGRCQSTALRLVYDNYKKTYKQQGNAVYNTKGEFTHFSNQETSSSSLPFLFELTKQIKKSKDVEFFLEESVDFTHVICNKETKKIMKKPPIPLTTSKLQQKASNDLRFSPKQTMMCAQRLYENGYITYMRTDSIKYSAEFVKSTNNYIEDTYGGKYVSKTIYSLVNKSKGDDTQKQQKQQKGKQQKGKQQKGKQNLAQEAHEAIRPTDIRRTSLQMNKKITNRELQLYLLIYKHSLASCMSTAVYNKLILTLTAPLENQYKSNVEKIIFDGWKKVYDVDFNETEYSTYNSIEPKTTMKYNKINSDMAVVNLKQHYNESKLIQMLEKKGIGRPSTFSSIISKIQDKGYVTKQNVPGMKMTCDNYELVEDEIETKTETKEFGAEKNKLVLQSTGLLVMEFLIKHFNELFEYEYTRTMELMLDKVANGEVQLSTVCNECNTIIETFIKKIKKTDKPVIKIDEFHTYTIGRYGPVIKCNDENGISFKQINKNIQIDLEKLRNGEYTLKQLMYNNDNGDYNTDTTDRELGEYNGDNVILKNGKYGVYVTIAGKNTSLKYINKSMEEIELKDVIEYVNKKATASSNIIKHLSDEVSIRKGRYGPYVFYKTSTMNRPKFISMKGVTPEEVTLAWVEANLNN